MTLPDGRKGMKITNIYPGTGAAKAGLQVGDVLDFGQRLSDRAAGNLAWIIANATPGNELEDGRADRERRQGPHGHRHDLMTSSERV